MNQKSAPKKTSSTPQSPTVPTAQIAEGPADKLKRATAVVLVSKTASASAFCINPAGLFLTARQVVDSAHVVVGGTITLVVNSGKPEARKVTAKLLRENEETALLQSLDADHGPTPFTALALSDGGGMNGTWNVAVGGAPSTAVTDADKSPALTATNAQCWFYYMPKGHLAHIHLTSVLPAGDVGGPVVGIDHDHVIGLLKLNEKGEPRFGTPVNTIELLAQTPVIAVRIGPPTDGKRSFLAAVWTALGKVKSPRVTLTIGTGKDALKVPMDDAGTGVYTASTAVPGASAEVTYTVNVNDGATDVGEVQGKVGTTGTLSPVPTTAPTSQPSKP